VRAEKLDIRNQFKDIFREVREKGECVVDTGSTIYVLKPKALSELKKLSMILDSLDYSVLIPDHGEDCLDCAKERIPLLTKALSNVEKGKLEKAKVHLREIPSKRGKQCIRCVKDTRRALSPLTSFSLTLTELDFHPRPCLASASKLRMEGEVVERYRTRLSKSRILEKHGEYHYDPFLPVDDLSTLEKSVLSITRDMMMRELLDDEGKVLDRLSVLHGVDSHKLSALLDIYVNKLGDLQYLIADKRLTDIYISPNGAVRITSYDYGDMDCTIRFPSRELERIATKLRLLSGKPFDYSQPVTSFFWEEENCRISAVAYSGNYSTKADYAIRLWPEKPWHILDILHRGSLDYRLAALLTAAANLGAAIIIGGDRSGGKSTLLQAFLFMIPKETRKVALLTEREIHRWFYEQDYNITEFKVHTGNKVTSRGMPIAEASKHLLIHGESGYLILNEVKYEEEARPFFTLAAAAGLSSLLTTMHAKSAEGVVQRLMIDFDLPLSALRNIDWILMTNLVRKGITNRKRRAVTELVEIQDFHRDPLSEGRMKRLAEYDPLEREWHAPDIPGLVESSDFLLSSGKKRGMRPEDVASLVCALERVYKRLYQRYPIEPGKFAKAMNRFFDVYVPGKDEDEILRAWWRRCSAIF
jgi:type IV secretory pathway ATPase VirB11/archaellum biosynthesis ATPase